MALNLFCADNRERASSDCKKSILKRSDGSGSQRASRFDPNHEKEQLLLDQGGATASDSGSTTEASAFSPIGQQRLRGTETPSVRRSNFRGASHFYHRPSLASGTADKDAHEDSTAPSASNAIVNVVVDDWPYADSSPTEDDDSSPSPAVT